MRWEQIQTALRAATLAPSPHNTQPWRFDVTGDRIDVLLDESRVLPVADPDGREARMSCGAAVFNLRLALHSQGVAARVDVLPDPGTPTLLARVCVEGRHSTTAHERVLANAIPRRHTNRRPFRDDPVPGSVQKALRQAALYERARIELVDEPARYGPVAVLLRLAEFTQREDAGFQAELARWLAGDPDRLDGVPPLAGGPPPSSEPLVPLRQYGEDNAKAPKEYEQEPLLGVLLTQGDDVHDHVRAGQALQRVLLTATACEVSVSFLSPAVELPSSRASLRSLLGDHGYPQAVLRFGFGSPTAQTRRRPVSEVSTCPETRA